jgi:ferredoxin
MKSVSKEIMMENKPVNSVQCLYFSPTGSTRKIIETIASGMGVPVKTPISITTPQERDSFSGQVEGDLLIVGVPVYAGTYPSLILSPLNKIEGTGQWALPIAVCGNVRMGTCLAELCGILKHQGFKIPAAGNIIAQHSFACEEFSIGIGRPDEEDLRKATEFGSSVVSKIAKDPEDITYQYGGNTYIRMYASGSIEAKGFNAISERYRPLIRVNDHIDELCPDCSLCVEVCPTGSIDPESYCIEDETCIRCFACTDACESGVKEKVVLPKEELASWFRHRAAERGEPLLYI